MSRYRRIETGTWSDDKFTELSAPAPNAQTLWLYLLVGPRTTTFPGLVVAHREVIARDLNWPVFGDLGAPAGPNGCRSLMDAWAEIEASNMAIADWKTGVILLPKALLDRVGDSRPTAHPGSPNQFRGWAKSWAEVPACRLKDWYLDELRKFASALDANSRDKSKPHAYMAAYREAWKAAIDRSRTSRQPVPQPVGDEYPNQSPTSTPTSRRPARDPDPDPDPVSGVRISSWAEADQNEPPDGHGLTFEIAHGGSGSDSPELPESGPARSSAFPPPGGFPRAKSQPYLAGSPTLSPDRTPGRATPGQGAEPGSAGPRAEQAGPMRPDQWQPNAWPKSTGRVDRPEPRSVPGSGTSTRTHSGKSQGEQARPVSASSGAVDPGEVEEMRRIAEAAGLRLAPAPRRYGAPQPGPVLPPAPRTEPAPGTGGTDGAA